MTMGAFSFRMDVADVQIVRQIAEREGVTPSVIVRRAVRREIDRVNGLRAVDIAEYGPPPQTVASGAQKVELEPGPGHSVSRSGFSGFSNKARFWPSRRKP